MQVYFVGRSTAQKLKGNPHLSKANFGYDDDRGDYNVVLHDHLAFRCAGEGRGGAGWGRGREGTGGVGWGGSWGYCAGPAHQGLDGRGGRW